MDRDTRCATQRVPPRDRRKAVPFRCGILLAALGLAGCTQGGGLSPMGETVLGSLRSPDLAAQAAELPYASLAVNSEGNQALMVMAHRTGEKGRDTFWQAGDYATLHLRDGLPMSSMGFHETLLGRWLENDAKNDTYRVHAHWRDRSGQEHLDVAMATLTCEAARPVDLPLTTARLERCTERLEWQSGLRSKGELWRDPASLRIWGGNMTLWPRGHRLKWQVARPWWSDAEDQAQGEAISVAPVITGTE
ncbi:YjbF family lipoprotein [Billgrantia endophytica]|uniref:YjbF family lipoprotein n=1 Tax=Billgrantia endophytica TaxID=2033802 RepID=A0A2N7U3N3_9GAMM|nr:YjbF family lipoprotein [Halomonas endophytica]PMR75023.1 hypothetical protein C1H69_11620 [Halomonas endophytica]